MKDALLSVTLTLPNGAATTTSSGIDLGAGQHDGNLELRFDAAGQLLSGALPNTQTIAYTLELSDTSNFATVRRSVTLGTQTGVTGVVTCPAIENQRYRPAANDPRYARVKAVKTGAADASGSTATLIVDAE